jgi:gas vesicle protein
MNAKGIIIATIIGLIIGFVGAAIFYNGRLGQLDSDLRASQRDYQLATEQYNALKRSNSELGNRLDSIQAGVGKAKDIIGQISINADDIQKSLRKVIDDLKRLKVILASIPSD